MTNAGKWAMCAAALALAGTTAARAHELSCEKKVKVTLENGEVCTGDNGPILFSAPNGPNGTDGWYDRVEIKKYPATITWKLITKNTHDTSASTVLKAEDKLLEHLGFEHYPQVPFVIDYDEKVSDEFSVTVYSFEDCKRLAKKDYVDDHIIHNTFQVGWDDDTASCSAQIVCKEEKEEEKKKATRTIGFWSTHPDVLKQCLGYPVDNIDLGIVEIDSLEDALGILWGSPAKYEYGGQRTKLDKTRFILARQLLAAICNGRVFHSYPANGAVEDAVDALKGYDCHDMESLKDELDAFNNSNTSVTPDGFNPGSADPQYARSIAKDPTTKTQGECATNGTTN